MYYGYPSNICWDIHSRYIAWTYLASNVRVPIPPIELGDNEVQNFSNLTRLSYKMILYQVSIPWLLNIMTYDILARERHILTVVMFGGGYIQGTFTPLHLFIALWLHVCKYCGYTYTFIQNSKETQDCSI
uniref:Uncharacterized protein n=1 Tax=Cacopsylla melanoneura TaxID=428564 RepID=A0A8D8Z9H3_9HEMI